MAAITDKQRREVARRLRDFTEDGSPADVIFYGTEAYDQMLVRALRQIVGKGDLFENLADLIDRPECTPEVGLEQQTCPECGAEGIDGWVNFCPNCGAEVAR